MVLPRRLHSDRNHHVVFIGENRKPYFWFSVNLVPFEREAADVSDKVKILLKFVVETDGATSRKT